MFNENTPLETHKIGNYEVYVKREDLYGVPPMPPLAKLRGIRVVLEGLYTKGVRAVGVFDTRVSKSGIGVSAICHQFYSDMSVIAGVPLASWHELPKQHQEIEGLGYEVIRLKPSYLSVCYYQLRNIVQARGGFMLPHGLPFVESALGASRQAALTDSRIQFKSLIVCCGTGTMLAGIICGLRRNTPNIYAVSAGMSRGKQEANIRSLLCLARPEKLNQMDRVNFIGAICDYYVEDTIETPFSSHPNYDKKAWHWLCDNIDKVEHPVLFWNIGA